ncbi:MAG: hypothetical protein E7157_01605 [Lactobacillales bacterium]|nr:hypothetical protein [Lactobacillales bacterium]
MNSIIGIISRKENNKYYVKEEVVNMILKYKSIPIIINSNNEESIDLCDGIIFPGGDDIEENDIKLIRIIHEKDIPCLGICLGMQEMGYAFNGHFNKISNYNHLKQNKYVHEVKINKKSKLYGILNKEVIKVNSRHKDYLIDTDLFITGVSDVIESIEDTSKNFFIGVQWHPESMLDYDLDSNLLIEEFIKQCHNYKLTKNI